MKKFIVSLVMSTAVIAGLTACSSESYSTVETNFEVSETSDDDWDGDIYDVNYFINDSGNLVVYAPETDYEYWRQISINGHEKTTDFVADEIDESGVYYVEVASLVQDGDAQVVLGHFSLEDDDAVDYAVIEVSVDNGNIVGVTNTGYTSDLASAL